MNRLACLFAFFVLWVAPSSSTNAAEQPVPPLDEVIASMRRYSDQFNAQPCWLVSYTQKRESVALPPGFSDRGPVSEFVNARKGKLMYVYRKIQVDPPYETWTAWRDNVSSNRILNGDYQIIPDFHVNFFELWFYASYLFVDTYGEHTVRSPTYAKIFGSTSLSESFWLALPRGVERTKNQWTVAPKRERLADGTECIQLTRTVDDGPRDVLWIDDTHGSICRKREYFYAPGKMQAEYRNDDLKELRPGLWLPMTQVNTVYNNDSAPSDIIGKVRSVFRNTVKEISFKELPDTFFVAPMITEGQVNDRVRGVAHVVHANETNPDRLVSRAILDANTSLAGADRPGRGNQLFLLFTINVAAILALLLVFQIRKVRSRRPDRTLNGGFGAEQ